jgi:hypothetical protein
VNRVEAVALLGVVQSYCPAQAIAEHTPDAWAEALVGVSFADARLAVQRLGASQPWIGVHDVNLAVLRIRDEREERVQVPVPNVDPDDVAGFRAEELALRRAVRDGRMQAGDAAQYERSGAVLTAGARPRVVGQRRDRARELEAGLPRVLDKAL